MGWDVGGSGFRIVLSAGVPEVVEEHLGHDVAAFLGDHDLKIGDIDTWVAHPGGPKVLEAMQRALDLPTGGAAPDLGVAGRRSATCRRPRCCTCSPRRWPTRRHRPAHPGCCWRWARASAPSWCCCGGERATAPGTSVLVASRSARSGWSSSSSASATAAGRSPAAASSAGAGHYPVMVLLHTGLLVGAVAEVLPARPAVPAVAGLADARPGGRLAGAALVVHQRRSAGSGTPGSSSCRGWPRSPRARTAGCATPTTWRSWSRAFALPLVHTAWVTALVFTVANAAAAAGADRGRGAGAGDAVARLQADDRRRRARRRRRPGRAGRRDRARAARAARSPSSSRGTTPSTRPAARG